MRPVPDRLDATFRVVDHLSLRDQRKEMVQRLDLHGEDFCRAFTADADRWLSAVAHHACGGNERNLALIAVGGYGRAELCPYSDLDVVLLHKGRRNVGEVADAIWYPVWDQGVPLDHSVRRPSDVIELATKDLRVALGLLDGRRIWGDRRVADPLLQDVVERWRHQLGSIWLPSLAEQMAERHRTKGEVAFLLEPDLKDAHGGLRDYNVWRGIATYAPALYDYVDLEGMAAAARTLLTVRVELHRISGRAEERLLLQEQDEIAAVLGYEDADALMGDVAAAGRRIAWISDEAWRRRPSWDPTPASPRRRRVRPRRDHDTGALPSQSWEPTPAQPHESSTNNGRFVHAGAIREAPVEPGIVIVRGEVALEASADVAGDPTLALRLAAAAAERDLPIALGAVHRLADRMQPPPEPWPRAVRDALVRVLRAGRPAISALETLDQQAIMVCYLPEWQYVRNRPQRNAYHRFTVDRHLLEAAANAASLADRVDRPDLLVLGALLHDIGKGYPGDHTDAGIELVGGIGARMGFPPQDILVLTDLVRYHLLLPDTATRRDLDDPLTIERVATAVRSSNTLELLANLTEADAIATGPAAWGTWKAGLVRDLVERVRQALAGTSPLRPPPALAEVHREMVRDVRATQRAVIAVDPPKVTVAAPDRRGLLASMAGVLALAGLNVQSANATAESGVAVEEFTVESRRGRWPDSSLLSEALDGVLENQGLGDDNLAGQLATRAREYAVGQRPLAAHPVVPEVTIDNDASATSTVVEVRASDEIGLLNRVTQALFDCELDVVAARVATLGGEVIDAFYVRDAAGAKVLDPRQLAALEEAVAAATRTM